MTLSELVGIHTFSGIDYVPSVMNKDRWDNFGNDILFCLDGVTYVMTEDEEDDYRSAMTDLEITERVIKNTFPGQTVECKYASKRDDEWGSTDILQIYSLDGKLILEMGTDDTDDYYPFTVFNYYPENMDINQ